MDERAGIEQVGPVPIVTRRDPFVEQYHEEAFRAGQRKAFSLCLGETMGMLRRAGPYDDTVGLTTMMAWLMDQLRGVGDASETETGRP